MKGKMFAFEFIFRDIFVSSFRVAKIQLRSYKKFYKHTTVQSDCLISNFVSTDNSIEERVRVLSTLFSWLRGPA